MTSVSLFERMKDRGDRQAWEGAWALVDSGRQVVALASSRPEPAPDSLLVAGDVDYDHADRDLMPPGVGRPKTRAVPLKGQSVFYDPLPGTGPEIESVASWFRRSRGREPDRSLRGTHATKGRLIQCLHGHRYIHLATHGFFADPSFRSSLIPADRPTTLRPFEGMGREQISGFYPGLLSGLVWAGANRPPVDPQTGAVDHGACMMTAQEVGAQDLSGTWVVVLSACETGLGLGADGQGVFSLQRAFHAAGARTVVASLWKVPDEATRRLMGRYYENLWQKGLSPLESLRRAQLDAIHGRDGSEKAEARGGGLIGEPGVVRNAVPPSVWAAWVLSGATDVLQAGPVVPAASKTAGGSPAASWPFYLLIGIPIGLGVIAYLRFRNTRSTFSSDDSGREDRMPPGGVGTRHGSAEPIRSGLSRKGLSALLKAAGALPDERCVVAGRARSDTEFLILGGIPLWFNQTHTFFAFTTRAIHVARKTTWTRVRPVQSFPNAHIDHVEVHTPWFGTSSLRFVFADSSSLQYDGVIRKFAKRVADHAGRIVPVRLV